jgi:hypothetical protein
MISPPKLLWSAIALSCSIVAAAAADLRAQVPSFEQRYANRTLGFDDIAGLHRRGDFMALYFEGAYGVKDEPTSTRIVAWLQPQLATLSPPHFFLVAAKLAPHDFEAALRWYLLASLRGEYERELCANTQRASIIVYMRWDVESRLHKSPERRGAVQARQALAWALTNERKIAADVFPNWLCRAPLHDKAEWPRIRDEVRKRFADRIERPSSRP